MNNEFTVATKLNRTEVVVLRGLVGSMACCADLAGKLNLICDENRLPYVYVQQPMHQYEHKCRLFTGRKKIAVEVYEDELAMIESMAEVFK